MNVRTEIAGCLALAALLLAACGPEAPAPESPASSVTAGQQTVAATVRPLTVFDTDGPQAITSVMEAWRAEGGGRFAIAESDYSTPFPEETDVLVAGSMARLWSFAEEDKLRPVLSTEIDTRIDAMFRDPESRWVALSYRARIVVYNPNLITDAELESIESYASLGDEHWRERLCLSSSRVDGNRLLVAWLIQRHGEREAELIVRRWNANLPGGFVEVSDEAVIGKIDQGECAIGLVDTLQSAPLQQSETIRPYWFADPGSVMIDITGAGVSRHAANPDRARELIEWLTTDGASAFFAASRTEFPANADAATSNALADWSANIRPALRLSDLGFLLQEADSLIQRAGYP